MKEFGREMARINATALQQGHAIAERLSVVVREIEVLSATMLTGVLSATLVRLVGEREAEKAREEAKLAEQEVGVPAATILPHPALLRLF